MWIIIFLISIILAIISFVYLISRFAKFHFIRNMAKENQKKYRIIATFIMITITLIMNALIGMVNVIICLVHLTIIWLICDGFSLVWQRKHPKKTDRYYCGLTAIAVTFIYLSIGWFFAFNVSKTEYEIHTEKKVGNFKIAMISDSHIGTTFDGDGFGKEMEKINAQNPDILVIVGDYVDDDTMREDMIKACQAFSHVNTKYGIYYVYGNHDKGYYGAGHRGYTSEELAQTLTSNGVIILEDENVVIDNRICLIGRQDASEGIRFSERAKMGELKNEVDDSLYSIVLDHQPTDYENQAGIVDMVLSGHTHGGQMIPVRYVGEWFGINDKTYGLEKREGTDFIVSSGISDWAINFKTGCKSEYVIINLIGK